MEDGFSRLAQSACLPISLRRAPRFQCFEWHTVEGYSCASPLATWKDASACRTCTQAQGLDYVNVNVDKASVRDLEGLEAADRKRWQDRSSDGHNHINIYRKLYKKPTRIKMVSLGMYHLCCLNTRYWARVSRITWYWYWYGIRAILHVSELRPLFQSGLMSYSLLVLDSADLNLFPFGKAVFIIRNSGVAYQLILILILILVRDTRIMTHNL